MTRRVLVTGAGGYVGRHVLEPLRELGFEVHAVGRVRHAVDGVAWHRAELLDAPSRRALARAVRPSHLVHLAWCAGPRVWSDPANLEWAGATLDLVQSLADSGLRRMVVAGSCAEYDWTRLGPGGVADERETPLVPHTLYGWAKATTQQRLVNEAGDTGVSFAWATLFESFGPFEHPSRLVPKVVAALLAGIPVATLAGRHRRDFLDVRDVARALACLLDAPVQGRVNVGSGEGTGIADVVAHLADAVGRPELLELGAAPDPDDEPPSLVAAVQRLHDEVGFRPEIPWRDGLRDTVSWWRSRFAPAL